MTDIKTEIKDLKYFGMTIAIILLAIAGLLFYKDEQLYQIFIVLGGTLFIIGLILPVLLKPFYFTWMSFAIILGWIMTRLILSFLFYFIISPIGITSRVFGKDFLKLKKLNNKKSYWNQRDKKIDNQQYFEQQF